MTHTGSQTQEPTQDKTEQPEKKVYYLPRGGPPLKSEKAIRVYEALTLGNSRLSGMGLVDYGEYRARLRAERIAEEKAAKLKAQQEKMEEEVASQADPVANSSQQPSTSTAPAKKNVQVASQAAPLAATLSKQQSQSTAPVPAQVEDEDAIARARALEEGPEITDWTKEMGGLSNEYYDGIRDYFQELEREHWRDIVEGRISPQRPESE